MWHIGRPDVTRHIQRGSKRDNPMSVYIGVVTAQAVIHMGNANSEPEMPGEDAQCHGEGDAISATRTRHEYSLPLCDQLPLSNCPSNRFNKRIGTLRQR
jgi:hypothetical protein